MFAIIHNAYSLFTPVMNLELFTVINIS